VFAAGGLNKGVDALSSVNDWIYMILGTFVLGYMAFSIGMALMDKKPWNDVVMDVCKVAGAGGAMALAAFAWSVGAS